MSEDKFTFSKWIIYLFWHQWNSIVSHSGQPANLTKALCLLIICRLLIWVSRYSAHNSAVIFLRFVLWFDIKIISREDQVFAWLVIMNHAGGPNHPPPTRVTGTKRSEQQILMGRKIKHHFWIICYHTIVTIFLNKVLTYLLLNRSQTSSKRVHPS